MTVIRAIDLPEMRADLVQNAADPKMDVLWRRAFAAKTVEGEGHPVAMAGAFLGAAERAELYYVSTAMGQLAMAAGRTLERFTPDRHDSPSDAGLIVYEEGIPLGISFHSGKSADIRGFLWGFTQGTFQFLPLFDSDAWKEPWLPGAVLPFPMGWFTAPTTDSAFAGWSERPDGVAGVALPVVLATWLLMQQPLARTADVEVDRAARKRLRRAGQEPKPVRVIELRRAASNGEQGDGDSNYQHQWIVRGHWRNHWHPKRQVHRPVWIAPHVKGPEGAPMIGGEKVYAWKR